MAKRINIRPTSSVYATYKRLSYQPWTALAEFVDNSTQSFYDHKDELMAVKYSKGLQIDINYINDDANGDMLIIQDNAYGMEWEDFQRAIILDKPPKRIDGRNEFGMGLKTAACWFGSIWSVESTQLNSTNKYFAEINIDELGKYKTEEIDVREEVVSKREHYTIITIKNLNKKIKGPRTIGKVKELLSSIYRVDIRSGIVNIAYNGTLLHFKEPPVYIEEVNGNKKLWKKEIQFHVSHEGKSLFVHGFIAIRIPGNVREAGLTLLRRGRVIIGGSDKNYRPVELFGEPNSFPSQRLYGELHMDNWPVTQAKDSFDWHNSGLEEAFIENLEPLIQEYKRKSDAIRVREKISTENLVQSAIDGLKISGLIKGVQIEPIAASDTKNNGTTAPISMVSEENDCAKVAELDKSTVNNTVSVTLEGCRQHKVMFNYKENDYSFLVNLDVSNPTRHWILVEESDKNTYTLIINMNHSFFRPLIENKEFLPFLVRMSIALVLAEIDSYPISTNGLVPPDTIRLKMNAILEIVRKGKDTIGI